MSNYLESEDPSLEIPQSELIYDWLIGHWTVIARDYLENGSFIETEGEWHFFRALEGRAIQDVWICPIRSARFAGMSRVANRYGTSVRFFHPVEQKWHVVWINPVSGNVSQLVAEKVGNEIVQTGTDEDGNSFRWVFSDIAENSCRWYGERSLDKEESWILEVEFFMRRQF